MNRDTIQVLVTGANGGLGLGICLRLIDDFLRTREEDTSLNIIFTTRSSRKGADTLKTLQAHLKKHHPSNSHQRVTFQPENVELTNLLSVRALARRLLALGLSHIDAVICNAGIGGWTGLNWWQAVPLILVDIRNNTVWPSYKLGSVGSITKPQLPQNGSVESEPPLGQVFCANVFGHYMLVQWLMPMLRAGTGREPSRVIWVSSIEPQSYHFDETDLQGLNTDGPYEHSKRLTDLLALTSNTPAAEQFLATFTSPNSSLGSSPSSASQNTDKGPPMQYVYQPGIVVTSVMNLHWILDQAYLLGIYLARWVGSPWSTVEPYTAAHGATWLALSSNHEIAQAEREARVAQTPSSTSIADNGKVKWGTAVTRLGKTTVRPTEVDKWGIVGNGVSYAKEWWGGPHGRKPGAVEAKAEDVHEFVAQGARAWEQMEKLRDEWEKRIEKSEASKTAS